MKKVLTGLFITGKICKMISYTNEKIDTNFLRDLDLKYCPINGWVNHLYNKSFYFYRLILEGNIESTPIPRHVVDIAKTHDNFYILFDFGYEAYAYLSFQYLHNFINSRGLHNKVVFLCAHANLDAEYDAWCKKHNETKILHTVFFNKMFTATRDAYVDGGKVSNTDKTTWFCCLNHRPHPHRLGTLIYLDNFGLIDGNIVTGHDRNYEKSHGIDDPNNSYDNYVDILVRNISPKYKNIILSKKDDTYNKLPLIYDNPVLHNGCQPFKITDDIYNNCLINLVTETYYFNFFNHQTPAHFITEKTLKPIMSKQMFIVIGEKGMLSVLRNMGFRTFSDFIDESYDLEPDETRMFKAVESLNTAINTYSVSELSDMTKSIREKNLKTYMKLGFGINLHNKLPI